MPFSPKDWRDYPDLTTPITAAALEDMETRLGAYTDTQIVVAARQQDVQVFTSSGTWTKPAGAAADAKATVEVIQVSGGSGGGSGPRRASGTQTTGGGGGGGGSVNMFKVLASAAPASSTVTVGAGGAGGASISTDNTNGASGSAGGNTNVNGFVASNPASGMSARGGSGASGGSTGTYGAACLLYTSPSPRDS